MLCARRGGVWQWLSLSNKLPLLVLFGLVLLGLCAMPASAQIAFDATSHSGASSPTSTLTWTHVLGSGTNRAVIIGVATADTNGASNSNEVITSVTFNGVYATPVPNSIIYGGGSGTIQTELFYLLDSELPQNTDKETYTIVVNFAGTPAGSSAGAISLSGVSQGPADAVITEDNTKSPRGLSVNITTQNDDDYIVDTISDYSVTALSQTSPQQSIWDHSSNPVSGAGSWLAAGSAGTYTMAWTFHSGSRASQSVAAFAPANGTPPPTYTLTAAVNPPGAGMVTTNPSLSSYPNGTAVQLTAAPAGLGYVFSSWSGDLTSTSNPATLAMGNNYSVTANFTSVPICTLTVNVTGSGSVSPSSGSYNCGTSLTLNATPGYGYGFAGWSGDYTGATTPANITLNTNMTLNASFTPVALCTLTTSAAGSGTVAPSSGSFPCGTVVPVTATPVEGWRFIGWSAGIYGTANPYSLTLSANMSVTATFLQNTEGDPRTISEPVFPPVCTVLTAEQSAASLNENAPDTARVQAAINDCPAGEAVEFSASGGNNAFIIAPITLQAGVTMQVDAEVTIFGSIRQADYSCSSTWCTPLIDVAPNTAPHPGSGVMGYGIIDGRGGIPLTDTGLSWWENASAPRPRLIFLGNTTTGVSADNFTAYKITLRNSPMYHLTGFGNGLVVWGIKIMAPPDSPNTDGVDPLDSTNVTITNSYISDGDDMISMKSGSTDAGLTLGNAPVQNVTISNMHTYTGHGISIGSNVNGGVNSIYVVNAAMDDGFGGNSANSLRIKSNSGRGGLVNDVLYENICINHGGDTLVFDPYYSSSAPEIGTLYPNFQNITIRNLNQLIESSAQTLEGYNTGGIAYPLMMTFDNVVLNNYYPWDFTNTSTAQFTLGPGPVNFANTLQTTASTPSNNVTVIDNISNSNPPLDCSKAFVYLAGELTGPRIAVTPGQPVTITAVLQQLVGEPMVGGTPYAQQYAPTGSINLMEGGTVVGTGKINGRLTYFTIPSIIAGAHSYTAVYSGDNNYAGITFGSFTLTTGSAAVVTVNHTPASPVYGQAVTETVNVASVSGSGTPTGTVALAVDGTSPQSPALLSGGTAVQTLTPATGAHSISASYSGNGNFYAATGSDSFVVASAPLTATCGSQTIVYGAAIPALTCSAAGIVNGDNITCSATTTATASSPVGQYPIAPTCSGTALTNYTVTTQNGTLTITQATPVVTVTCPSAVQFDGQTHACTATVNPAVNGSLAVTYNGAGSAPSAAGVYSVVATFTSSDPNWTGATAASSLTINQVTPTVTVTCPQNVLYNGSVVSCTATVTGVGGITIPYAGSALVITYTGIDGTIYGPSSRPPAGPGTYNVVAVFTSSDPNYTNASGSSIWVIEGSPLLSVNCPSVTYNGQAQMTCQGTATGVNGAAVSGSFSFQPGSETDAGTYTVTGTFTSTDPFYISGGTVTGSFTINPASPSLSVTCNSVIANGSQQLCSPGGSATGISAVAVTGSWTYTYNSSPTPPSAPGSYTVVGTFTSGNSNYSSGSATGSLTITAPASPITCKLSGATVYALPASVTYGTAPMPLVCSTTSPGGTLTYTFTATNKAATYSKGEMTILTGTGTVTMLVQQAAVAASHGKPAVLPATWPAGGTASSMTLVPATLSITAATKSSANWTFGGKEPALVSTVTGLVAKGGVGTTLDTEAVKVAMVDANGTPMSKTSPLGTYYVGIVLGSKAPAQFPVPTTPQAAQVTADGKYSVTLSSDSFYYEPAAVTATTLKVKEPSGDTASFTPTLVGVTNANSKGVPTAFAVVITNTTGTDLAFTPSGAPDYTVTPSSCEAYRLLTRKDPTVCTFSITFTPTAAVSYAGETLTISGVDNDAENDLTISPVTLALNGAGYSEPTATVTGANFLFTGGTQTVTVTNNNDYALTLGKLTASADFAITSSNCSSTLAANQNCSLVVTYAPPKKSPPTTGSLTIASSIEPAPDTKATAMANIVEDFTIVFPD